MLPNTILTFVSGTYVSNVLAITSVSLLTEPASTIQGTTLPASTASPVVTVITTTQAAQSSNTPTTTTKKSGSNARIRIEKALYCIPLLLLLV